MQRVFPIRRDAIVLAACVFGAWTAVRAAEPAAISGVVRDAHGTPQMGVLIELLQNGISETTYTDLRGRYNLRALVPGAYEVHASAALFLPTLRHHVVLRGGVNLLNLTMSGLLDATAWLPRDGRLQDSSVDDWKWTLRSPTNRPLLRLAGLNLPSGIESSRRPERQARLEGGLSTGGFGTDVGDMTLSLAEHAGTGRERLLRALVASPSGVDLVPASDVGMRLRSGADGLMQREMTVRYRDLPQVQTAGRGLTVLQVSSAERMLLGDMATVEVGAETEWLRAGSETLVSRPFLRVSSALPSGWALRYTAASVGGQSSFDGAGQFDREAPVAVATPDGHLLTERGLRQELRLHRTVGRLQVRVAYHHDVSSRSLLSGRIVRSAAGTVSPQPAADGLLGVAVDRSSGAVQAMIPGFRSNGLAAAADLAPWQHSLLSVGYVSGDTLSILPGAPILRWQRRRSQGAFLSARAELPRHGTRIGVAYRWQPAADLAVIVPAESPEMTAYLGASVRQRIGFLCDDRRGTETQLTLSGSNLLRQGQHSVELPLGTVAVASALQQLRAGVEVTF